LLNAGTAFDRVGFFYCSQSHFGSGAGKFAMNDFTVYIVDDEPGVLQSVQSTLNSVGISAHTFPSAQQFIRSYSPQNAACLILDLQMPGMTGMELIEWLRAHHIDIPVIILSGHANVPAVVQSMKLGAAEFLEKPVNDHNLIEKVREVFQSETNRCNERAKIQEICNSFATLTERERELLELLAQGLSSKQIAAEVGISLKTVENHRSHLLAKTRATNVASLVRMKMIASERAAVA
jgi:two-component system, LuxR family, response regulator FixJ